MSEYYYEEKGPIIFVSDPFDPSSFKAVRNPEYSDVPEVISMNEFLTWNYSEEYGDILKGCIEKGEVFLGRWIELSDVYRVEFHGYDFHRLYLNRIDESSARMNVVLIAYFTVYFVNGKSRKTKEWYRIQGTYRCNCNSNFFESIDVYRKEDIPQDKKLSQYLVPCLSRNGLDSEIEEMLGVYMPEALDTPKRVDLCLLAKRMGFKVLVARQSLDNSILGCVLFDDTVVTYFDKEGTKRKKLVKGKTILLDVKAHENRHRNPEDTLAHECIHIYEHRLFYDLQKQYRLFMGMCDLAFEDLMVLKTNEEDDPIRWMENQAEHMSPRLRMPLRQAAIKTTLLYEKYSSLPDMLASEKVAADLKEFYKLSLVASQYRMVEMGFDKARGLGHYANGKPVPGYIVENFIHYNQTYTIDFDKLVDEYFRNVYFREIIDTGKYIYVEGHLCLNSDKFIWTRDGKPMLSAYASTHMCECCLLFTVRHEAKDYHYTPGIIKREFKKGELAYLYADTKGNKIMETDNSVAIMEDIPDKFHETVIYHMTNLAYTREFLAEKACLSVRTVQRMRQERKKMPSLETIILISIGMNLYPALSNDLLQKANRTFESDNKSHCYYQVMLTTMYRESVYSWNEFLAERNLELLKDDNTTSEDTAIA